MTRVSVTRQINVRDPMVGVPSSGYASLIAQADAHQAVRPAGMNSGQFTKALFEAYGSGTFVQDYSTDGAFVIAGSGGHAHYEIVGGAGFDFTTRQWFWRGTPGYTEDGMPSVVADTNGSPWYELTGFTETPAPPHPYANMIQIRTADGGGTKGSVMHLGRSAVAGESVGSRSAHRFDCETGIWTRAAASVAPGTVGALESTAVFDPVSKRYYTIPDGFHATTTMQYLDATTWEWGSISYPTWPAAGTGTYYKGVYWSGNGKRLMIVMWGTVWQALDLDNPSAGWTVLTKSGDVIDVQYNVPVVHQGSNDLYWRESSGAGNTIKKITPPADPLAGTWTVSTVTLLGDTIPEFIGSAGGGTPSTQAYKSLFYIPSYGCLGWVTAGGVALLNP